MLVNTKEESIDGQKYCDKRHEMLPGAEVESRRVLGSGGGVHQATPTSHEFGVRNVVTNHFFKVLSNPQRATRNKRSCGEVQLMRSREAARLELTELR